MGKLVLVDSCQLFCCHFTVKRNHDCGALEDCRAKHSEDESTMFLIFLLGCLFWLTLHVGQPRMISDEHGNKRLTVSYLQVLPWCCMRNLLSVTATVRASIKWA